MAVERGRGASGALLASALATFSELIYDVAFRFATQSIILSISLIMSFTWESEFPPTAVASVSGHASKECGADKSPRRISLIRPKDLAAAAAWKAWPASIGCSANPSGAWRLSARAPRCMLWDRAPKSRRPGRAASSGQLLRPNAPAPRCSRTHRSPLPRQSFRTCWSKFAGGSPYVKAVTGLSPLFFHFLPAGGLGTV